MILARVTGRITSTIHHPDMEGRTLLVLDKLDRKNGALSGELALLYAIQRKARAMRVWVFVVVRFYQFFQKRQFVVPVVGECLQPSLRAEFLAGRRGEAGVGAGPIARVSEKGVEKTGHHRLGITAI